MTAIAVKVYPDTYVDSVVALRSMRAMTESDGVDWATAIMATPANLETLRSDAIEAPALRGAGANDFCLVARAGDQDSADAALAAGADAAFAVTTDADQRTAVHPRTIRAALAEKPGLNVAIVSVPGAFAALTTFQALEAGMHVLLFSDNVPLGDEIALKEYARERGLFVMGPGAGTAMLAGTGLGFANAVQPGRVGVVAAAGTGAQEAMVLLDRWGAGVTQVIGVGGRDVSEDVGGTMAIAGVETLRDDPDTDAILFVSKPPAAAVAHRIIEAAGDTPIVAALIGLDVDGFEVPDGAVACATLETGVTATLAALGLPVPELTATSGPALADALDRLGDERRAIRGLFSGGTLCYESQVVLGPLVGDVYSNAPLDGRHGLPAPPDSHQCLDLGEEEYTRGRPHPMIDAEARLDLLREHGADPAVAVILLDVVIGHGSHADPAGVLAPICAEIMADGGPQIVTYVLGTEADPQRLSAQRQTLADAGCIVTETAARASLAAAALATRRADLLEAELG